MTTNFDHHVGLYIEEEDCQACTFWDICPRTYTSCNKNLGWQFAISTWKVPKEEEPVFDPDSVNVGC